MRYTISRTSDWLGSEQPCSQAYQNGVDRSGAPIWCVDVNSLNDLQSIVKETNSPVILGLDSIEIYDDYRE